MKKQHLHELCEVFSKIRNKKQALLVLKDILTPQEIESIVERWQIVKQILNEIPQRKISRSLNISISKVTRGSRAIKKSRGGFKLFLKRK